MNGKIVITKIGNAYKAIVETGKQEYKSNAHGFVDGKGTLFITNVTVKSNMRGQGIGEELVKALISKVKPKAVKAVYAVAEAQGFWNRLGIKEGKKEFYANKPLAAEREKYILKYL